MVIYSNISSFTTILILFIHQTLSHQQPINIFILFSGYIISPKTILSEITFSNQMSILQKIAALQKQNIELTLRCNKLQIEYFQQVKMVQRLTLELKELSQIHQMCKKEDLKKQCQNCIKINSESLNFKNESNNSQINQLKKDVENLALDLKLKQDQANSLRQQLKLKQGLIHQKRQENIMTENVSINNQIMQIPKNLENSLGDWSNKLLASSSILDKQGLELLVKWLIKPIERIDFKFKASSNGFRLPKYYQKCGDLTNTIVIAKTTKNKIIGGYTPLSFYPPNYKWIQKDNYQVIKDESNSSFLFSLDEKHKFQLKKSNHAFAIQRYKFKSLIQFYDTFQIHDNSNTLTTCGTVGGYRPNRFRLNQYSSYNTSKYAQSQQSYLKITGEQSQNFLTAQWQVYKVFFG